MRSSPAHYDYAPNNHMSGIDIYAYHRESDDYDALAESVSGLNALCNIAPVNPYISDVSLRLQQYRTA